MTTKKQLVEKAKKVIAPKAKEEKKEATKKKVVVKKPKATKEKEVVKEVTILNNAKLVEKVISNREVKYIYPEDVIDTLSRKKWRQKVRNTLHKMELVLSRIKDQESAEWKKAKKEYDTYSKKVIKDGAKVA